MHPKLTFTLIQTINEKKDKYDLTQYMCQSHDDSKPQFKRSKTDPKLDANSYQRKAPYDTISLLFCSFSYAKAKLCLHAIPSLDEIDMIPLRHLYSLRTR